MNKNSIFNKPGFENYLHAQYEIKKDIDNFRGLRVSQFNTLIKHLITLSAGAIIFSVNSIECFYEPRWIFITSIIFFLITIFSCLLEYYFIMKKYEILEELKRIEGNIGKNDYLAIIDAGINKCSDENNGPCNNYEKLEVQLNQWNTASFINSITQNISFMLGISLLFIYYLKSVIT